MADATPPPPLPTGGTQSSNRGVMIVLSYLWLLALLLKDLRESTQFFSRV